jgi:hypothetical protein
MYALVFQRIAFAAFLDFFYFPIWWYTFGLVKALRWSFDLLQEGNETLAPGIWLRNIFVPMFGQYDWQGRIISFVMRLIQIIFRSIFLLFWLIICVACFVAYLLIPPIIAFGLYRSFSLK